MDNTHPTVLWFQQNQKPRTRPDEITSQDLRKICMDCGADDTGFVSIDRPELDSDRADILTTFAGTRTVISVVRRMHPLQLQSPMRSVANKEFHTVGHEVDEVCRSIVSALLERGIRALNPPMGFPMEMANPAKQWLVSSKLVAVAAGLGKLGIHRNVIHPKFGNFILLGTVLVDARVSEQSQPIDYNPCLGCNLCVAACPVGAIRSDGHFNFSACYTHNYREFMGGFSSWVEVIADSRSGKDYRKKVSDPETHSMWQSLSSEPNYKSSYCMAVCPAGEDVIGEFLVDKPRYVKTVVKPLQDKEESLFVIPGSDAEEHVKKHFPNRNIRPVFSGLRPISIATFLRTVGALFQPRRSKGLDATFHFTFVGREAAQVTIDIRDQKFSMEMGLRGAPNVTVTADGATWISVLRKDASMIGAIIRRKIVIKGRGSIGLMRKFERCFPA